jgi:hypothetical protein
MILKDSHHFSSHRADGTLIFFGYCWTTVQMNMSATTTTRERLHCITQRITVTSMLLGYYSNAMRMSMPEILTD